LGDLAVEHPLGELEFHIELEALIESEEALGVEGHVASQEGEIQEADLAFPQTELAPRLLHLKGGQFGDLKDLAEGLQEVEALEDALVEGEGGFSHEGLEAGSLPGKGEGPLKDPCGLHGGLFGGDSGQINLAGLQVAEERDALAGGPRLQGSRELAAPADGLKARHAVASLPDFHGGLQVVEGEHL
jgi:hypothetical protein